MLSLNACPEVAAQQELWDLQIPMAAVIDWEEEESLQSLGLVRALFRNRCCLWSSGSSGGTTPPGSGK